MRRATTSVVSSSTAASKGLPPTTDHRSPCSLRTERSRSTASTSTCPSSDPGPLVRGRDVRSLLRNGLQGGALAADAHRRGRQLPPRERARHGRRSDRRPDRKVAPSVQACLPSLPARTTLATKTQTTLPKDKSEGDHPAHRDHHRQRRCARVPRPQDGHLRCRVRNRRRHARGSPLSRQPARCSSQPASPVAPETSRRRKRSGIRAPRSMRTTS